MIVDPSPTSPLEVKTQCLYYEGSFKPNLFLYRFGSLKPNYFESHIGIKWLIETKLHRDLYFH
jgi:hypothetical protein